MYLRIRLNTTIKINVQGGYVNQSLWPTLLLSACTNYYGILSTTNVLLRRSHLDKVIEDLWLLRREHSCLLEGIANLEQRPFLIPLTHHL